ncbi:MAG: hypothetical protein ACLVAW_21265 [Eisenbergiella massiliensis]
MFLVNEGENSVTTSLRLEDGHICQIWDAWNGTIKQLELPVQEMRLSLGQRESLILVTDRGE